MRIHSVKQGEDVFLIAHLYGLSPETLWDLPENQELWVKRQGGNVLREGDILQIPEPEPHEEVVPTGARHNFYVVGRRYAVRVRLVADGEARGEVPYIFRVTAASGTHVADVAGMTTEDGFLVEEVPVDAVYGEVVLDPGPDEKFIPFDLGHMEPADVGVKGIQAMLSNMGYACGEQDGMLDDLTRAAVRRFQEAQDLEPIADDATDVDKKTRDAIVAAYTG